MINKNDGKVKVECPKCKGTGKETHVISKGSYGCDSWESDCYMCDGKKYIYAKVING